MTPPALKRHGIAVNEDGVARNAAELLAYPGIDLARLAQVWPELAALVPEIAEQLEIDARYAGYLERQERDIASFRRDEALMLPPDLDYAAVGSLSREIRDKLAVGTAVDARRCGAHLRGDPGGIGRLAEAREASCGVSRRSDRKALPRSFLFHVKHWHGSKPMRRC